MSAVAWWWWEWCGDDGGVCGGGGVLVVLFVGLLVSWFVTYCFGVIISFVFSF